MTIRASDRTCSPQSPPTDQLRDATHPRRPAPLNAEIRSRTFERDRVGSNPSGEESQLGQMGFSIPEQSDNWKHRVVERRATGSQLTVPDRWRDQLARVRTGVSFARLAIRCRICDVRRKLSLKKQPSMAGFGYPRVKRSAPGRLSRGELSSHTAASALHTRPFDPITIVHLRTGVS